MLYFSLPVIFLLSTALTYVYISYAQHKNWLDIPNQRSSHTRVTPRGGGMVFICLWLVAVIASLFFYFINIKQGVTLLAGTLIVAGTAFCDDRRSLSAKSRAIAYFIAALIVTIGMGGFDQLLLGQTFAISLGWLGIIFAILAIVWSINLFNFMDGTDGIAAVEAIFVLGVGGCMLWQSGGRELALLSWLLVIAVAGFLVWNKPPAKLFMGDVGSAALGFIIMTLALVGEKQYGVPAVLWFAVYGIFLFDATVTLIRRLFAKERWYEAHRLHAYQRLHQAGWSHSQVLLGVIGVNIGLSIVAMLCFYWRNFIIWGLLLAGAVLSCLYYQIERRNPMYKTNN